ncbi:MAG: SDR family oxidoreductase [Bacteroidota bacterium]
MSTQNQRKTAVVTGGTKGIGRAIVEKFLSQDIDVITCARNEETLQQFKSEMATTYPESRLFVSSVDMSKKDEVLDFIDFIKMTGRDIEILVNNAGVFVPGEIHQEEEGMLELMMQTNLYSAYYLTRGIVPKMKKKKRGFIFNICSIASLQAYANGGSYSISKFALYGFSKSLREELKPFDIRVSSILPGATFTASWEGVDLPEDRFMKAEDVAEVLFTAYNLSGKTVIEDLVMRPQLGDI